MPISYHNTDVTEKTQGVIFLTMINLNDTMKMSKFAVYSGYARCIQGVEKV
jgi:hypothetical protein